MTKKRSLIALAALLIAAWVALEMFCDRAGAGFNKTLDSGPYKISEPALALHRELFVADLHADSLLWSRNIKKRADWGHVDLPRLREGGVGLQAFGLVTKTPAGQNFQRNSGDTDRITALAMVQRWPPWTWTSPYRRALYQAGRLRRAASDDRVIFVGTRSDLDTVVKRRSTGEDVLGVLLGLEGAHALAGDLGNVQNLFDAGLRMLGFAHFFDNEISGSAHGVDQGGLSDLGRQVVRKAEELGIALDLAHASPQTVGEVLAMAKKPVVVSHTGVRGTCGGPRNLSDTQLRGVAATGGVVGIGLFKGAVCGQDVDSTVKAIAYAVRVAGVDHVGLGSDFDGAVTTPIDVSGIALVTEGLLRRGFSRGDIGKIMGDNVARVLRETLPGS